jgi:hypothetical protein
VFLRDFLDGPRHGYRAANRPYKADLPSWWHRADPLPPQLSAPGARGGPDAAGSSRLAPQLDQPAFNCFVDSPIRGALIRSAIGSSVARNDFREGVIIFLASENMIQMENSMKENKIRTGVSFLVIAGLTVPSMWLPPESDLSCTPATEMCAQQPVSFRDEPAPERAPRLMYEPAVAGSSVSVSGLSGSSVSYRT